MATTSFEDIHEVPNLNFNITKLREELDRILKTKKFNSPGVTHFGAISINQYLMMKVQYKEVILEVDIGLLQMILEKRSHEILI